MLGNSLLAQTVRSIYKGIYKSKLKAIIIVFFFIFMGLCTITGFLKVKLLINITIFTLFLKSMKE